MMVGELGHYEAKMKKSELGSKMIYASQFEAAAPVVTISLVADGLLTTPAPHDVLVTQPRCLQSRAAVVPTSVFCSSILQPGLQWQQRGSALGLATAGIPGSHWPRVAFEEYFTARPSPP